MYLDLSDLADLANVADLGLLDPCACSLLSRGLSQKPVDPLLDVALLGPSVSLSSGQTRLCIFAVA
jgi:hypothetical protein